MANRWYAAFCGLFLLFFSGTVLGQNVGIGIASPNGSAQLDISSTSRGLLIPRMTTSGIDAIPNPARGLLVYDSVKNQLMANMGSASSPNWQSAVTGSGWSLSGNSGTDPATQFIGSIDNKPVNFRVNNISAGKMDGAGNIFWGLRSGQANSSGYSNIAIGTDALKTGNSFGAVAIGDSALMNNTAFNNIAIGYKALMSSGNTTGNLAVGPTALQNNTTGEFNIAIGYAAMFQNTYAGFNLALGYTSMYANTIGAFNTALGHGSLGANTTGQFNTAVGYHSLGANTAGQYNIAVGQEALYLSNGNYNTAVGFQTLRSTTLSDYNTALGFGAGNTNDLGYNNVFLGANTGTNGSGYYNCIAIGQDVYCTNSNQVQIGNPATTVIGGWVGWSRFSDGRVKKDVSENVKGLDFILKLRPVTYHYDMAAINRRKPLQQGQAGTVAARPNLSENQNRLFSGFIAQEVEQASQQSGYDFAGVEKPKNDNDLYTLRYDDFVVPLVKAVQELSAKVDRLEKENAQLRQEMDAIKKM